MSTSEAFPFTQTNDEISGANLFAIAPSTIRDARYQGDFRVKVSPTVISQGAHFKSAPSYQSQGWTLAVHPEGKRYAYILTEQRVSVVTESQVTDTGVAERIEGWIALIHARATEEDVHLLETSDLFLELEPDSNACNYWFADHALRTIFWLRSADSREIGLPNSCSDGHLQYSLEENYWIHVEMFPGTAAQYATTALNELQIILLHARADALTSDVPTFPYTAEESEKFINLLQCSKDHATNPYITTVVARLWVVVANHRFFTHFGENHCRMSAVHSVLEAPIRKRSLLLTGISKVLFDLPNEHRRRLENIWVDELVYAAAWRKYVSERVEDLRLTMIWLFALTISNILMIPTSHVPILNESSNVFCVLGLCIALVLHHEQRQLIGTGSSTGAAYLDTRNTSYGFEPTAIVHSLPRAAFVWAFFLFMIQGFWMAFGDLPSTLLLPTIIPVGVVMIVACIGIWLALHPREKPFEDTSLPAPDPLPISPMDQKDTQTADGMV